jgi:CDP-glucose 4,6-dehydratase
VTATACTRLSRSTFDPSSGFGGVYRGKKVFVTGHTGFKGSWLCEWLLLLGADVYGYSIDTLDPSLFNQLRLQRRLFDTRGDVLDIEALRKAVSSVKPDLIFHLAAQSLVRQSYDDPVRTFTTNVTGSINVLEVVRLALDRCVLIMVTTDKCYENRERLGSYRETDPMGGYDPYSASKAAAEIAIAAYRRSFFSTPLDRQRVAIASARAGNAIGGGDWAADRIVPDCVRALQRSKPIVVRNENATRPWQHVLEPVSGYLLLGQKLWEEISTKNTQGTRLKELASAFNFGPLPGSARTVRDVVAEVLRHWPGKWVRQVDPAAAYEARRLNLSIDKAINLLGWRPVWDFNRAVAETVAWYRSAQSQTSTELLEITRNQIAEYTCDAVKYGARWAIEATPNKILRAVKVSGAEGPKCSVRCSA